MRLSKISFRNYRCLVSEDIEISDYTAFVGPNNCGKSTILKAIGTFYEGRQFEPSDFAINSPDDDLSITLEFQDLSSAAATDLGHYVRNGRVAFELIGTRLENSPVLTKCRGIRYGLPEFAPFFAATSAGERRPIYDKLRSDGAALPVWKNLGEAEASVRAFEAERTDQHVPIPSDENAYGVAGPISKTRKYLEWIYIPAVKEASSEVGETRNSSFSKLVLAAVRSKHNFSERLQSIRLAATQELQSAIVEAETVLSDINSEIDRSFKSFTTSNVEVSLRWDDPAELDVLEPSISTLFKDGSVRGSPDDFGHGIQRTYLMTLLSLAARVSSGNPDYRLLIGIEEPELYQHPPQAKYLANSLVDLSRDNNQIILTTHSPYFVMGRNFDSIRALRRSGNVTKVQSWSVDEQRSYCAKRLMADTIGQTAALSGLDKSLQIPISEMFFAGKVVLVEGPEDVAIITSYIEKKGLLREFLGAGCHIIPVGGKTKMPMLIAMARGFGLDIFCVFDMDLPSKSKDAGNDILERYAADIGISFDIGESHYFESSHFFGFRKNIQESIGVEIPDWRETTQTIADEWGWSLNRMDKDPMLMDACVERILESGAEIPILEALVTRLKSFWGEAA